MQTILQLIRDAMERLGAEQSEVEPIDIATAVVNVLGVEFIGYKVENRIVQKPKNGGEKVYLLKGAK